MAVRSATPFLAAALAGLGLMSLSPPAFSQSAPAATPGDTAPDPATVLFDQSKEAYRSGHFDDAATLLLRAYELSPHPVLLYNLARAYEGSGRIDDALAAYRRYLQAEPNPSDRGAIEERCATLQREIEQRAALERQRDEERRRAEAEARRHREAEERARGRSLLPWVTLGTGVAAVAAGSVLGVLAESQHRAAENDPAANSAASKQSTAQSFATAADVCFVAGGVLAAGGAVWAILDGRAAARASGGAIYVAPSFGGVAVGRRF